MKVCMAARDVFYRLANVVFQNTGVAPNVIEIGVHNGSNALVLYQTLNPKNLVLVDSWDNKNLDNYTPFSELPYWILPFESFHGYYGGDLRDQSTFDRLLEDCRAKFNGFSNVSIIKSDSIGAIKIIKENVGIDKFDFVYIDANHQYEFALRDLMYYSEMVAENGILALNDCCHSADGIQQNLGVLEATSSFIKRTDFVPVAMTNTAWTDVLLVRRGSQVEKLIDHNLRNSDVQFVEVPAHLLAASRVVDRPNGCYISFCDPL
jgi:hypothetical protein